MRSLPLGVSNHSALLSKTLSAINCAGVVCASEWRIDVRRASGSNSSSRLPSAAPRKTSSAMALVNSGDVDSGLVLRKLVNNQVFVEGFHGDAVAYDVRNVVRPPESPLPLFLRATHCRAS